MGDLRIFPSGQPAAERRVYAAVVVYFLAVAVALLWPVYSWFGAATPLVLGMPLSLFYLAAAVVVSFVVMLALYLWEARRGLHDEDR